MTTQAAGASGSPAPNKVRRLTEDSQGQNLLSWEQTPTHPPTRPGRGGQRLRVAEDQTTLRCGDVAAVRLQSPLL